MLLLENTLSCLLIIILLISKAPDAQGRVVVKTAAHAKDVGKVPNQLQ